MDSWMALILSFALYSICSICCRIKLSFDAYFCIVLWCSGFLFSLTFLLWSSHFHVVKMYLIKYISSAIINSKLVLTIQLNYHHL